MRDRRVAEDHVARLAGQFDNAKRNAFDHGFGLMKAATRLAGDGAFL